MNRGISKNIYSMMTWWGPRADDVASCAARWRDMLSRLSAIDPVFGNWRFGGWTRSTPLAEIDDQLEQMIAECISTDDENHPLPGWGYHFLALNDNRCTPCSITISTKAGNRFPGAINRNRVSFETDHLSDPDPAIITYRVFRGTLLAIAAAWDIGWGWAAPHRALDLDPYGERPEFGLSWMTYLAPRLAALVTPPAVAEVERFADGSLLLAATTETFRVDNPAHVAAGRAIEAAMAPLNALPRPEAVAAGQPP